MRSYLTALAADTDFALLYRVLYRYDTVKLVKLVKSVKLVVKLVYRSETQILGTLGKY